jgi:hypothetical protein
VLALRPMTLVPHERIATAVLQVLDRVLVLLLMPLDCRRKHLQLLVQLQMLVPLGPALYHLQRASRHCAAA